MGATTTEWRWGEGAGGGHCGNLRVRRGRGIIAVNRRMGRLIPSKPYCAGGFLCANPAIREPPPPRARIVRSRWPGRSAGCAALACLL